MAAPRTDMIEMELQATVIYRFPGLSPEYKVSATYRNENHWYFSDASVETRQLALEIESYFQEKMLVPINDTFIKGGSLHD